MGQQMIAYSAASSYSIVFGTDLITICIDFSNAFSKKKNMVPSFEFYCH